MGKDGIREFNFDGFDGGINLQTFRSSIKNNELSDCCNMIFDKGALVTRPGIDVINELDLTDEEKGYSIKPLGSVNYTDDVGIKLFLVTRKSGGTYYNKILVLRSNGECNCFELINFSDGLYEGGIDRVNCFVINGKEIRGTGIYIVLGIVDSTGKVGGKYIFEINSDFNSADVLSPSQIYAPFVYINGRGNKYYTLESSLRTAPKPKTLEDYNMLSSGFRSAFTTDSASYGFNLPRKLLSNKIGENIEISYTSDEGITYKWIILSHETTSLTADIQGTKYKFYVNRGAGYIESLSEAGDGLALPRAEGIYNNLVVKAYKAPENDRIFKMNISESFNSRVFLSGYENEGNLICFSKQNNPLYFPTSNLAFFGDKTSNILAIKPQNDRLVVFKAHQIGVCSSVKYSEYNVDFILSGSSNRSSTSEKMEIKTVNSNVGCIYPDTILSCSNRLVFWGSDKRVYTMTSTSNYLQRFYRISDKVDSRLCGIDVDWNAFALDWEGRYMLFVDNQCFTFDYNTPEFLSSTTAIGSKYKKDLSWFYLNYDFGIANPIYAMRVDDNIVILAKIDAYGGAKKVVCYTFSGNEDKKATSLTEYAFKPIHSSFSTAVSNFDDEHIKRIVGIEFTFSTEFSSGESALKLEFMNENKSVYISQIEPSGGDNKEIAISKTPCIGAVRGFGVSLKRDCGFGIKQINVAYKRSK